MGGGGIIQQRAKTLLIAATDLSFYKTLALHFPGTKAQVDAIDAKEPMSRDQDDCDTLIAALGEANGC
jgi:hypothetical protein